MADIKQMANVVIDDEYICGGIIRSSTAVLAM
jgi:hypothetical protein